MCRLEFSQQHVLETTIYSYTLIWIHLITFITLCIWSLILNTSIFQILIFVLLNQKIHIYRRINKNFELLNKG